VANPSLSTERKNGYFHSLSKVLTNESQYSFESKYKSSHTIKYSEVWADSISYCQTSDEVDAFILDNPNIIKKYSEFLLSEVPGSNGQSWYINDNDKFIRPFISPVDVPDSTTNLPSIGFEVQLFSESGNRISPTAGVWYVDYYAGIIHFENGYTPQSMGYGKPKITVYNYIGNYLSDILDKISLEIQGNSDKIITSSKLLIENNTCFLPIKAKGDIIWNSARVYEFTNSEYFTEYSCNISDDGFSVLFNDSDNLNGQYCVVSYLGSNL